MTIDDGPVAGELSSPGAGPVVVSAPASTAGQAHKLRLRLDLSYDGTDFAGWAIQPGQRTVAGVLFEALTTLLRAPVPLVVAGRTDAGVHAAGQVAHIDVDPIALAALAPRQSRNGPDAGEQLAASQGSGGPLEHAQPGVVGLLRRLAGLLPLDVRVFNGTVAPAGFDARFSALRRQYRYRVSTSRYGADPLRRRDTFSLARPLDLAAMRPASDVLLGIHDFAAFCKAPSNPVASTIRELQSLNIRDSPDEDSVVLIEVSADAFCHSMVRSLVGVLLSVGTGRDSADRPAELLAAQRRTSAVRTAPAHGLTLVRVDYPADYDLLARAEQTRAVRLADDPPQR